jgi:hypothetical protein
LGRSIDPLTEQNTPATPQTGVSISSRIGKALSKNHFFDSLVGRSLAQREKC